MCVQLSLFSPKVVIINGVSYYNNKPAIPQAVVEYTIYTRVMGAYRRKTNTRIDEFTYISYFIIHARG